MKTVKTSLNFNSEISCLKQMNLAYITFSKIGQKYLNSSFFVIFVYFNHFKYVIFKYRIGILF